MPECDERTPPKRIAAGEFRALGLLQELNREFLHPIGLALEILTDEAGNEEFGGVWDYRDVPGGLMFEPAELATEDAHAKAASVTALRAARLLERLRLLGGEAVQPLPPVRGRVPAAAYTVEDDHAGMGEDSF